MSLRKISFFILSLVLVFASCTNDDGEAVSAIIEIDLEEKRDIDNDSIINYLETHYYNSSAFDSNNTNINNLVITEINKGDEVPTGNALLMSNVEKESYTLRDVSYDYYILRINQGGGYKSPKFSDNVLLAYEGINLFSDAVFESRLNPDPSNQDLSGVIDGWQLVIPSFNTSIGYDDNGDGTNTYNNSGAGVMFIPSGLAYLFNTTSPLRLSPLIFKFELLNTFQNDHDNDGIPSYLEDLYKTDGTIGSDNQFTLNFDDLTDDTDDDTDNDGILDYLDSDDDGDGILTRNEITITTENKMTLKDVKMIVLGDNQELLNEIIKEDDGTFTGTIITFTDIDTDGIPDYLDAE